MKGTQRILLSLLLFYSFWFLLYFFRNINAAFHKLLFIPLVLAIVSTMFYTVFRKSIRHSFRQLFDKNYKYNKPLKKIKNQ